jgi:hypothetical protein
MVQEALWKVHGLGAIGDYENYGLEDEHPDTSKQVYHREIKTGYLPSKRITICVLDLMREYQSVMDNLTACCLLTQRQLAEANHLAGAALHAEKELETMSNAMQALLAKLHDAEQVWAWWSAAPFRRDDGHDDPQHNNWQARRQTEQECYHERQARSELQEQLQQERLALRERGTVDSAAQLQRWERIEAAAIALLRQLVFFDQRKLCFDAETCSASAIRRRVD